MELTQQKSVFIGVDAASPSSDYTAVVLLLNSAREDQRRNDAEVFASRIEVLASYVIKHEMTAVEAVQALRVEADRIRNEVVGGH